MVKYGYIINPAIYKQDSRDILWSQKKGDGTTVLCVETTREADSNLHLFDTKQEFKLWRGEQPEEPAVNCTRCGVKFQEEELSNGLCQFCEASETQPLTRKQRQARIDYLSTQFKGTPIGGYIDDLIDRYAVEVKRYEENGTSDLAIAVADETTPPYSNYLGIKIPTETMGEITVRHGILMNIFLEPSFVLGGGIVDKADLMVNAEFTQKISRNLNTAMDVYFTYGGETYGIRFQDWNIFNTLTDQECEDKLQDYIFHHTSIENPANAL
jgi:hypothetical protein